MILPSPSPATERYWRAAREGTLLLHYCDACSRWFHPQQVECTCGATLVWRAAAGRGTLVAHAIIRHRFNPVMEGQTPYTLTLTRLDEGPQLLTSLPGAHPELQCAMAMQVEFDPVTDDVTLPRFAPIDT